MKLFFKIIIAVFITTFFVATGLLYFLAARQIAEIKEHIIQENRITAAFISKELEQGYLESRWPFEALKELQTRDDFVFWWIVNDEREIYLANDDSFMETAADDYFPEISYTEDENVLLKPNQNYGVYKQSLQMGKEKWSFWLGFSLEEVTKQRNENLIASSVLLLLTTGIFGIVFYFQLRHFLAPIDDLVAGTKTIAAGSLEHRLKIGSPDELGELASAFNSMTEKLQASYSHLEEKVKQKTAELEERLVQLDKNKEAMMNLLEDARELEEALKAEKEGVERKVEERTVQLKQAQEEVSRGWLQMRQEKAKLTASINSLSSGFIVTDINNQIVLMNPAVDQILGKPAVGGEWTLKEMAERFKAIVKLEQECQRCMRERRVFEKREIVYGSKFLRLFIGPITMIKQPERVIGLVLAIDDITEEKMLERSQREFFSIASHELRTPLTAIRGNVALIQQHFGDRLRNVPEVEEMLKDVHASSVRLIQIVRDFLDVSRLELRRMEFKKEKFDLAEVTRRVAERMMSSAKEKNLYLKVEVSEGQTVEVMADKGKIEQVLTNLIGNAIKFTQKGGVNLSLGERDGWVQVLVADTGIGISQQNQQRLFHKFEQASERLLARDMTQGTGLGLYISRLLMEGMGGKVYLVRSELDKGSTFGVSLPLLERV